jgi:hypothetical protein
MLHSLDETELCPLRIPTMDKGGLSIPVSFTLSKSTFATVKTALTTHIPLNEPCTDSLEVLYARIQEATAKLHHIFQSCCWKIRGSLPAVELHARCDCSVFLMERASYLQGIYRRAMVCFPHGTKIVDGLVCTSGRTPNVM